MCRVWLCPGASVGQGLGAGAVKDRGPNGFHVQESGWTAVWFAYRADLVETLKAKLPQKFRRWDAGNRQWLIAPEAWPQALRVFQRFGLFGGGDAQGDMGAGHSDTRADAGAPRGSEGLHRPGPAGDGADPFMVLYVHPQAPREVIQAAYRALAGVYHPDRGGDGEMMTRLNLAYERAMGMRPL